METKHNIKERNEVDYDNILKNNVRKGNDEMKRAQKHIFFPEAATVER